MSWGPTLCFLSLCHHTLLNFEYIITISIMPLPCVSYSAFLCFHIPSLCFHSAILCPSCHFPLSTPLYLIRGSLVGHVIHIGWCCSESEIAISNPTGDKPCLMLKSFQKFFRTNIANFAQLRKITQCMSCCLSLITGDVVLLLMNINLIIKVWLWNSLLHF